MRIIASMATLALMTLNAAACGGGATTVTVTSGQPAASSTDSGASVNSAGGEPSSDGQAGQLALVDSGFSQYSSYGTHGINYALLIKNQSQSSSFDQADVTISFLNKRGTSVASSEEYVHAIAPGAVGAVVGDVIDVPAGAKATKMVVELGEPYDWVDMPEGAITGKVVSVHASTSYGTYEVKTTALFSSTYAQQLKDVDAFAVYRNAQHRIIGGVADFLKVVPPAGKANLVFDDLPDYGGIRHVEVYATPSSITEFG